MGKIRNPSNGLHGLRAHYCAFIGVVKFISMFFLKFKLGTIERNAMNLMMKHTNFFIINVNSK